MYIYHGKINYQRYAVNEEFIIVFPKGLNLGDPAYAVWQWTVDEGGKKKVICEYTGSIDGITISKKSDKKFGLFYDNYYHFECSQSADEKTLKVDITSVKAVHAGPNTLDLKYKNSETGCDIFTGKFNFLQFAQDELISLIFAVGDVFKTTAIGVWQWTVTSQGVQKKSKVYVQKGLDSIVNTGGVKKLSFFQDTDYKFSGELSADGLSLKVTVTSPEGATSATTLKRTYQLKTLGYL